MLVRLNGLEFNVEIEGDGAPLLLLHGFTGSVRAWDDLRERLREVAQLIAVDLIGHASSSKPTEADRYSLEWCARDCVALLDALQLERVNLLGYSMGGRAALRVAVTSPERIGTLILESASPGIEDAAERSRRIASDGALAQRILTDGVEAFVHEWEQQPLLALQPHVSDAVRAQQRAQRLSNTALGLANSLRGMGAGQQQPLWAQLRDLHVPVQLVVGASDTRYVAIGQRMARCLPQARLAVVPDAGHTVHLDQPTTFGNIVAEALTNRVTPADFPLSTN